MDKKDIMNRKYGLYVLLSFLLASCSGMNDIIQEYLDRGEINYIGKTDSIYAIGGKNRITFKWIVNADPRIEKMSIAWQNGDEKDTLTCDVDRAVADNNGYVSKTFDMPEMEGTFAFYAFHSGSKGYNSVSSEVTGTIYGDRYASGLKARRIQSINAFVSKTILVWALSDGSISEDVTYIGNDGKQHTVSVKSSDTETELPDHRLGTDIKVRSLYVPEKESVVRNGAKEEIWDPENEFYVESVITSPKILNLWEDSWEIIDFSSQEPTGEAPNGLASMIIDNNSSSYWHSEWKASTGQLPHHLTVDMKSVRLVKEVMIAKRQTNTDLKTAHIEVSTDGMDWIVLDGDFEYPKSAEPNAKTLTYDNAVRARYVKVVVTESHRVPFVSISEVKIYGTLE